jgi:hypothetical protein
MTPWITAANLLVTAHVPATAGAELLVEIERNLAAHFASAAIQPRVQAVSGRSGSKTLPPLGMGLNATPWGQAVLALDPTGELVGAINNPKRRRGKVWAMGNSPIDVEDWQ